LVSATTPGEGYAEGGTSVQVTVENFANLGTVPSSPLEIAASGVDSSGSAFAVSVKTVRIIPAKVATDLPSVRLEVLPSSAMAGSATIELKLNVNENVKASFDFNFRSAPTGVPAVKTVLPTSGPYQGGTQVTLVLTNMRMVQDTKNVVVEFATTNNPWTILQADSSIDRTVLTVVTPRVTAANAGEADVRVYHKLQGAATSALFKFSAIKDPVIAQISPPTGQHTGSCNINMRLTGVTNAFKVGAANIEAKFGGVVAPVEASSVLGSGEELEFAVTLPAGTAGSSTVSVKLPQGTGIDATSFSYTQVAGAAQLTLKDTGSAVGGEEIYLKLTNFAKVDSTNHGLEVLFGTRQATVLEVCSFCAYTSVRVRTPVNAAGPAQVVVRRAVNPSFNPGTATYTYVVPSVTVSYLTPTKANLGDRVSCRLIGLVLSSQQLSVKIGSVPANDVVVQGEIVKFTVPNMGTARGMKQITFTDGPYLLATTPQNYFEYVAGLSNVNKLVSFFPRAASQCGGTQLAALITTNNAYINKEDIKLTFADGTVIPASSYAQVTGVWKATFVSPVVQSTQYLDAAQYVTLTVGAGNSADVFSFVFTVEKQAPGTISGVSKTSGTKAGGTVVSMSISGLPRVSSMADIAASFGSTGVAATAYAFDEKEGIARISVKSPPGTAGDVTLTARLVTCAAAQASTTFAYVDSSLPYLVGDPSATTGSSAGKFPIIYATVAKLAAADEVTVQFGSVITTATKGAWTTAGTPITITPPPYDTGTDKSKAVTVSIYGSSGGLAKAATFKYTFSKDGASTVTASTTEGPMSGGTRIVAYVANFPKVFAACDVEVRFGSNQIAITSMQTADEITSGGGVVSKTTLIFMSPPSSSADTATITITARGDAESAVSFGFTYQAPSQAATPAVQEIRPTRVRKSGGQFISVDVSSLPLLATGVSTDAVIYIGNKPASSIQVMASTRDMTTFKVGIPIVGYVGPVDISVYTLKQGPAGQAMGQVEYYDDSVMTFDAVTPTSAKNSGGNLIQVKYSQYTTEHIAEDYTVTFGTYAGSKVEAVEPANKNGVTTLTLLAPVASATGLATPYTGLVTIKIDVGTRTINVPYTYVPSNTPTIVEFYPRTVSYQGGAVVVLTADNVGTASSTKADFGVTFGAAGAFKTATISAAECRSVDTSDGATRCTLGFVMPSCGSSCMAVPASLAATGKSTLTFTMAGFQPCDYTTYCPTQLDKDGLPMFPDTVAIAATVSQSAKCIDSLCLKRIKYSPSVKVMGQTSGSTAGGSKHVLELKDYPPITAANMPVIKFGASYDIVVTEASYQDTVGDRTYIEVTLPPCNAGMVCNHPAGSTKAGTSGVSVAHADMFQTTHAATADFQYVIAANGDPVMAESNPPSGAQTGGNVNLRIRMTNFPAVDKESVAVTFGTGANAGTGVIQRYTLTTSGLTAPELQMFVSVPDSTAPGVKPVTVTASKPDGTSVSVSGTYEYLAKPKPLFMFAKPARGPTAGGTVVTLYYDQLDVADVALCTLKFGATAQQNPIDAGLIDPETGYRALKFTTPQYGATTAEVQATVGLNTQPFYTFPTSFRFSFVAPDPYVESITYTRNGAVLDDALVTEQGDVKVTVVMNNFPKPVDSSNIQYKICQGFTSLFSEISAVSSTKTSMSMAAVGCGIGSHAFVLQTRASASGAWATRYTSPDDGGRRGLTSDTAITFVRPPLKTTASRGVTNGAQTVEIEMYGITPAVTDASQLTATMPNKGAFTEQPTIEVISSVDNGWTKLRITTPPRPTGSDPITVTHTASSVTQAMPFEYISAPEMVYPTGVETGFKTERKMLTVEVKDFPVTDFNGELIGESKIQVTASDGSQGFYVEEIEQISKKDRTMRFKLQMPTRATTGTVTLNVGNKQFPNDGSTSFQYMYKTPPAVVLEKTAKSGPMDGGTDVEYDIAHLTKVTSTDQIQLKFQSDSGAETYASVDQIIYSDEQSTRIKFKTPETAAGKASLQVTQTTSGQTVSDEFTFTDTRMTVAKVSTTEGLTTGGQNIDIDIAKFPMVEDTSGVVCKFAQGNNWQSTAEIVSVVSTSAMTNLTIKAPTFNRVGYAISHTGANTRVECFPMSNPDKKVSLPTGFTYKQPLMASTVKYNSDYTGMDITLNQDATLSGLGSSFPCSQLMTAATATALGVTNCKASGSRGSVIKAQRTQGSSVCAGLGAAVSFKSGAVQASSGLGGLYAPNALSLMNSDTPKDPVARVSALGKEVDPCGEVVLDGSQSDGPALTYQWSCTNNAVADAALKEISGSEAKLQASQLPTNGFSYEFQLVVVDCLGRTSSPAQYKVYKSSQPLPSVRITPDLTSITSTDSLQFKGSLEFSKCAGQQQLSYRWTLIEAFHLANRTAGAIPVLTSITEANAKESLALTVSPTPTGDAVLSPGYRYTFQLVAFPTEDPTLTSVAKAVVTTVYPDIKAGIKGGAKVSDTTLSAITIDGSSSADPAKEPMAYEWSCVKLPRTATSATAASATGTPCRDKTGTVITFNPNPTIVIPADTLSTPPGTEVDKYRMTLTAKGSNNRRQVTTQQVEVKAQAVLKMEAAGGAQTEYNTEGGKSTEAFGEEFTYQMKVNAEDSLNLESLVTTAGYDKASTTIVWKEERAGMNLANLGTIGRDYNTEQTTLLLKPGTLQAGGTYSFTAEATEIKDGAEVKGTSTINIKVNEPPSGGACTASPATGYTQTTEFKISCAGFTDDSGKALKYSFGTFEADGTFNPLVTKGESNYYAMTVGEAGTVKVGATVYDDMGAKDEFQLNVVASSYTKDPTLSAGTDADKLAAVSKANTDAALAKGDTAEALNAVNSAATETSGLTTSGQGGRRLLSGDATSVKISLLNSLNTIVASAPTTSTPGDVQLKVTPLESIMSGFGGANDGNITAAAGMLQKLSNSVTGQSMGVTLADSLVKSAGNILSSMGASRPVSVIKDVRNKVADAFLRATKGVLKSKAPGEALTTITSTTTQKFFARRITRASMTTYPIKNPVNATEMTYSSFTIPTAVANKFPTATGNALNDAVDYFITATTDIVNGGAYTWKSQIHGLSLSAAGGNALTPITGLTGNDRIMIDMATVKNLAGLDNCMFFDKATGQFSREGVETADNNPGSATGVVRCATAHLTDFGVTASHVPTAGAACFRGNHSLHTEPEMKLVSSLPGRGGRMNKDGNITLNYGQSVVAGSGYAGGQLTLKPDIGVPIVIPTIGNQVNFVNTTTVVVNPTYDLPAGQYTVQYPAGAWRGSQSPPFNASACCAKRLLTQHVHAEGGIVSTGSDTLYYGLVDLRQEFILEFDITLTSETATDVHLFTIGHSGRHGPAIYKKAGKNSLHVKIDTENQPDNGFPDVGELQVNIKHHFEIAMSGNVLTVKQDGANTKCADLGSTKFLAENEPVYVGDKNSTGSFTLENLVVYNQPLTFTVPETVPPSIVKFTPNASDLTAVISKDDNIVMTFNVNVRPGTGQLVLKSGTTTHSIDISDTSQVTFSGKVVTVNPSIEVSMASTSLTVSSGVITSMGSWETVLASFIPHGATLTNKAGQGCAAGYTESTCYNRCRANQDLVSPGYNCVAFKIGISGVNAGKCCMYSAYSLTAGTSQVLTATPGETFSRLVPGDAGLPFAGIAGPTAKVTGSLTVDGITTEQITNSPALQLSMKKAIATVVNATVPGVSADSIELLISQEAGGRRLLSGGATVQYTINLTPDQASAAPSAASAMAASLVGVNPTFTSNFASEAVAAAALTPALAAFLAASGTQPTVTQGAAAFSFSVTDQEAPILVSTNPVASSTALPGVYPILTFHELIKAGTGNINLVSSGYNAIPRSFDVTDTNLVVIEGMTITIKPQAWITDGAVTVTMGAGVITDMIGNAYAGLSGSEYVFNVLLPTPPPPPPMIHIGVAANPNSCSYQMTSPFYTCHDFSECTLFVRSIGSNCGAVGERSKVKSRKVTMEALQKISAHGFKQNGGDGRDTIINFSGGGMWPEGVVAGAGPSQ